MAQVAQGNAETLDLVTGLNTKAWPCISTFVVMRLCGLRPSSSLDRPNHPRPASVADVGPFTSDTARWPHRPSAAGEETSRSAAHAHA